MKKLKIFFTKCKRHMYYTLVKEEDPEDVAVFIDEDYDILDQLKPKIFLSQKKSLKYIYYEGYARGFALNNLPNYDQWRILAAR